MKNSIILKKDGTLKIKLLFIVGKDEDLFIALAPSLRLSARSRKSAEEALSDLERIVKSFFSYYNTPEDLDAELLNLGWNGTEEPEQLDIPRNIMKNKHETKEVLIEA